MHQYVMGEEAIVNEVINDVGADQDERFNYDEFAAMMNEGSVDNKDEITNLSLLRVWEFWTTKMRLDILV
ncbi:calcium-dependent kinase 29 [Olea europaea subsp. europaea]|uniref:Calcium-dependent kinase 29 n=1 Tax=Olea europaea subsp. europaea TaxID=158383 RepID=A0A8S0Q9F6_OLEEU|nr:calcium-dependent kinase 29 [Olea europaea subsp. europaea]